ncbi:MAG TPA: single-stranded DNA-binding protein [Amycolatopsis sp.]|nr:single-stranded DNA-binding protein [Amycolatopsis sp.]
MAVGETPVTLIGSVYTELESRRVGGHHVVSFWLRSKERRFDKDRDAWVDGRHFTVRVQCWRRLAMAVLTSLRKGDPIIVHGRLYTRSYDEGGETRAIPEVEASAVGPNLMLCVAPVQRARPGPGSKVGGDSWQDPAASLREPRAEAAEPASVG